MPAIQTILCYPNVLPFATTDANIDEFMQGMKNAGVTHVQVNHLPDLMHPELLAQPKNVYLWFGAFGPPLDLYVSSRLNQGLWPEMYLERNRRTLLQFVAAARRYGIQPLLYLCEPRFVPERFFRRHPNLRGPRVDNPVCSQTPIYALCTDRPEVREHYGEMMTKLMQLVPDLAMASIFTSDSGSGFDYNPDTYAGANGAGFNRGIPLEKRVARWLRTLLDAARAVNPEFTINLTSGFPPETRAKILAICPPGIVGSVYGLYDWEGGLEEHWGYHQAVWGIPKAKWNVRTLDRLAAAADRFADMQERFDAAAHGGREPVVHAEIPTYDYPRPLRYVPHPFETIRLMQDIVRLGATRIAAWGVINPPSMVPFDVNAEAMRLINENVTADPTALVTGIAERWVGQARAARLVEIWRQCDQAWTHRPMWTHFGLLKYAFPGPLVPDLTALRAYEIAYYRTVALDTLENIQGLGAWLPMESDERNRDYVLHEIYQRETLPVLRDSVALLEQEAQQASGAAREAWQCQRDFLYLAYLYQRTHYNWYEAGRYLSPGDNPGRGRSLVAIIDDEMENTRLFIEFLRGRAERFLRLYPSDFMCYEFGPSLVTHLEQRLVVMQAHRHDPPRSLSDRLLKMRDYLKSLAGEEV